MFSGSGGDAHDEPYLICKQLGLTHYGVRLDFGGQPEKLGTSIANN